MSTVCRAIGRTGQRTRGAVVSSVAGRSADFPIRRAVPIDAPALAEYGARTFIETFGPQNTAADLAAFLAEAYGVAQQKREIEDPNNITLLIAREVTNDCIFTFVHVDERLRPQRVPRVFPASYDEDARYLAAYRRNRRDAEYKSALLARG